MLGHGTHRGHRFTRDATIIVHPYATHAYAEITSALGTRACTVPAWGCSVIVRSIKEGAADACGCYPIAVMAADADIAAGLAQLRSHGLVSITLVLDDFHRPALTEVARHFDIIRPFKTHYIRRKSKPFSYEKHHRYRIRRAFRTITAQQFNLRSHASEWKLLYARLADRHGLAGVHDFPDSYFEKLQAMDGVTAFGSWLEGSLVSAQIWVSESGYVHGHLAASSDAGYREGAAYAAYDASMEFFRDAEVINLGGGAGFGDAVDDGLGAFKRGFANDVGQAYVCGAVLDRDQYDLLVHDAGPSPQSDFFPHYRAPRV